MPPCFDLLRRRLEDELAGKGTCEYIRVLRLLELNSINRVERAVRKALQTRTHSRDGIAQFIPPPPDPEAWGATTFTLDGREHLRHVKVTATDVQTYASLLSAGGDV